MARRSTAVVSIAMAIALVLGACGDDAEGPATGDGTGTGAEPSAFTVNLSLEGIDMPAEVEGGVVEVTLETDLEGGEVIFTQVPEGTTEDAFKPAAASAVSGQGIPGFIGFTTGVNGEAGSTNTIVLPEGNYIAWSLPEPPEEEGGEEGEGGEEAPPTTAAEAEGEEGGPGGGEGEGGPPPEAVLTHSFTATPGEPGDLPDPGDSVTARDYSFDVRIEGGSDRIIFRNEGPTEYHHAVLFNFGTIEASVVEENIPALLSSEEGAPPPDALKDVDFSRLEGGSTAVLSPDAAIETKFEVESGNTYALACFISDRAGGPPHAIAHGMVTVFTAA